MRNINSLPRMRGDRPIVSFSGCFSLGFTPHARGSTPPEPSPKALRRVYPACAGIDPSFLILAYFPICLPRMRGDRPVAAPAGQVDHAFTPHARGSTHF